MLTIGAVRHVLPNVQSLQLPIARSFDCDIVVIKMRDGENCSDDFSSAIRTLPRDCCCRFLLAAAVIRHPPIDSVSAVRYGSSGEAELSSSRSQSAHRMARARCKSPRALASSLTQLGAGRWPPEPAPHWSVPLTALLFPLPSSALPACLPSLSLAALGVCMTAPPAHAPPTLPTRAPPRR